MRDNEQTQLEQRSTSTFDVR